MMSLLAPDRVHTSVAMAETPFRCLIRRLRGTTCVARARHTHPTHDPLTQKL